MNDQDDAVAVPRDFTKTDLRLTRAPADTPRGRLHRVASMSMRAVDEIKRVAKIDKGDLVKLRSLARRGLILLGKPTTRGERVLGRLYSSLDRTVFALTLIDVESITALCEGTMLTLVQLETAESALRVSEAKLKEAEHEVRVERAAVTQLRTLLAAANTQVAKWEATEFEATGSWAIPTRQRVLTADEKRVLDDPDAR